MIPSRLSRRYAKALIAIGIDSDTFEEIGQQLEQVAALWREHPHLRRTLENPTHPLERQRKILSDIANHLGLNDTVSHFLLLLLDRHRIQIVSAVAQQYALACDQHVGRLRADIVSATALDSTSLRQLRAALEAKMGKQVVIRAQVDPALIAGSVTRIGSIVYDGSLDTKLEQLRDAMMNSRT